ncbi:ExbD/TolR family protein [Mangrovitalea sediminis]|uniref:ExbD/TolR family protein n=1 Tax=Mangrovitalea sediminis TaxID=1982043 RepID=UPI000BE50B98|nr:biopolymer transporter ExbD [Mangrovitalea sediminis]
MRRRHRRNEESADLDITAFMNLMIVLVPVLLLSMVFTHMSILDLNFPGQSLAHPLDAKHLQLRVALYADHLEVSDNQGGVIQSIPDVQGKHDFKTLREVLKAVKAKVPEKKDIVLLARPDTDYQTLITAMDTVRSYPAVVAASLVNAELFPDVALGDAPPEASAKPLPGAGGAR